MQDQFETVSCVNCAAQIPRGAAVCPQCQADQRSGAVPPTAHDSPRSRPARREPSLGIIILAGALIANGLICLMVLSVLLLGMGSREALGTLLHPRPDQVDRLFSAGAGGHASPVARTVALIIFYITLISPALDIGIAVGLMLLRQWARIAGIAMCCLIPVLFEVGRLVGMRGPIPYGSAFMGAVIAVWLLAMGPEFRKSDK